MAFDLECRDVVKRFDRFTAVAGVSLAVPPGTFFSILGPSGCGKTSLLRMIAGFGSPTSGDILIKGRSVLNTPPNKRPANMVFQHLALFPMMTVAENIGYGLRRRGLPREDIAAKVAAVLARIGLPDAGPKTIDQLSGGQKQRVAIARCMVLDPTVLLLDEPLGALDLKLREHMKLELKQLQHQFGTTFVYITHDQSEALVMSDQVAVMNAGRFEQVGAPQDLYYRPATAFVAGFIGDNHRWTGRVAASGGGGVQLVTDGGLVLGVVPAGTAGLGVGDRAAAYIRPEAIEILPTGGTASGIDGDGINSIGGVLESLLFNGASSRAMIRLGEGPGAADGQGAGELIAAALPQPLDRPDLAEGARVTLRFAARHTACFALPGGAG